MNKKRYRATMTPVILVILVAVLGAIFYVWLGAGYGVKINCMDKKILGIERMPPPAMSVIPPEPSGASCLVDYSIYAENSLICSGSKISIYGPMGYAPCSELSKYHNSDINAEVSFYRTNDGALVGQDKKTILFE